MIGGVWRRQCGHSCPVKKGVSTMINKGVLSLFGLFKGPLFTEYQNVEYIERIAPIFIISNIFIKKILADMTIPFFNWRYET